MTSLRTLPQSFVGGELSPRMFGRPDDPKYQHGAARLRNFYVDPIGAASHGPGSEFVHACPNPSRRARLVPYRLSGGETVHAELGFRAAYPGSSIVPGYARFHRNGGTVLHSVPWSAASAYAPNDLVTTGGVLYRCKVAHTNQVPPNVTYWESLEYVPNRPFAVAGVNIATNEITFAVPHELSTGEPIEFTNDSGGAPVQYEESPGVIRDLAVGLVFYAIVMTPLVIKVSLTAGGAELNLFAPGTGGPHRMHRRYTAGNLVSQGGSVFYCRTTRPIDLSGFSIEPGAGNENQWYLEPATGEYEVPTTLAITEEDLFAMTYSQQGSTLTLASQAAYTCELLLLPPAGFDAYATWRWLQVAFTPTLATPTGVVATATKRGNTLNIVSIAGAGPISVNTTSKHQLVPGIDVVFIECAAQANLHQKYARIEAGASDTNFIPVDAETGAYFPGPSVGATTGTVRVTSLNSDDSNSYVVTAVSADLQESTQSAVATVVNNLSVSGAYNTITWGAVAGAVRYRIYKLIPSTGLYGFIGQSTDPSFQDRSPGIAATLDQTPPILDTNLASAPNNTTLGIGLTNTPGAVAHFEGRRGLAGTVDGSQDVWLTRSNTEKDLTYSIPVKATDRIQQRIKSRIGCTIRHLVPLGQLVVLTDTTEFRVSPVNTDAITPDSFAARAQSYVGAARVQPEIVHSTLLFAGASGGHVYQMRFSDEAGGYLVLDLCERASHLFDGLRIVQMAAQLAPVPVLWCVSSAGKLLGLTFVPAQQVAAWHWTDTDGVVESASAGKESGEDRVYEIVQRTINGVAQRYVERRAARTPAALADCWFVDCGLRLETAAAVATVGNLGHLEGKEVAVFANGMVQARRVVVGAQIELETPLPAGPNKVLVGLPREAELQSVPATFAIEAYGGGRPKSVSKVWVRVEASGSFEAGPSLDDMTRHEVAPGTTFSGLVEVRVPNSWTDDGQLFIRQRDPLPLTVVSLTAEMAVGG